MLYVVWETVAKFVLHVGNSRKFNTQTEEWMSIYIFVCLILPVLFLYCVP